MKRFTTFLLIALSSWAVVARTHQYDDLGRLTRVAYEQGGGIAYAYDVAGNMLSATTLDLPASPANFTALRNDAEEAVLSWTDVAENETGYTVYRRDLYPTGEQSEGYFALASLPAGSTGYTDSSIGSQRNYEYWVVATNNDGDSAETKPLIAVDPTPFVIKTLHIEDNTGEVLAITFTSISGDVYAVEVSANMLFWDVVETLPDPNIYTGGNGIFLGDFSGDETTVSILLPDDEPSVFVRVVHR